MPELHRRHRAFFMLAAQQPAEKPGLSMPVSLMPRMPLIIFAAAVFPALLFVPPPVSITLSVPVMLMLFFFLFPAGMREECHMLTSLSS